MASEQWCDKAVFLHRVELQRLDLEQSVSIGLSFGPGDSNQMNMFYDRAGSDGKESETHWLDSRELSGSDSDCQWPHLGW